MKKIKTTPILLSYYVYMIGLFIYVIREGVRSPFFISSFVIVSMLLSVERIVLACSLEVNIKKLWVIETIVLIFILNVLFWIFIFICDFDN